MGLVPPARDEQELLSLWRVRLKAVAENDPRRADELEKQIVGQRKDVGIRRLDAYATVLLEEAGQALQGGDALRAQELVDQARQLAPGLPEIESFQASAMLEQHGWAVHRWFIYKVKNVAARLGDFQRRTLLLSDVLVTLFLVLTAMAAVFLLAQVVRHALGLYHDLGRAFPVMVKAVIFVAALFVLAVPLYFGFGPLLLIYPLSLVLWQRQRLAERVTSVMVLVFLGVTPWAFHAVDRLSEAGTGLTQALFALGIDPTDSRALEAAEAALSAHPNDWQAAAAVGLAQKRQGKPDPAVPFLRTAVANVPSGTADAGIVRNNLANALFAQGRPLEAEKLYNEAISLLVQSPEPRFNLSRLYTRMGRLEQARKAFADASNLDPDRVASWNDDLDLNLNRFVVDMELSTESLTRRELATLFAPTVLSSRAWLRFAGPVPEAIAPVAAVVFLALVGVLGAMRKRMRLVVPCSRCAHAAEVLLGAQETAPLCEQCNNLFVRNIPVDRRIRFEKEERIARYRLVRQWGLRGASILLPGLPAMLSGHPLRGVAAIVVVAFLALRLIMPHGLLLEPYDGGPVEAYRAYLLAASLGLIWVANIVLTFRSTRGLT